MSRAKRKNQDGGGLSARARAYLRRTPEQEAALRKALAAPCLYCATPALLGPPQGEPADETNPIIEHTGHIWRDGPPPVLHAKRYGLQWVADVPAKYFAERFAGFSVRLVGVEIGFRLAFLPPPPPFTNSILTHLWTRPPAVKAPFEGAHEDVAYVLFSGCVIEHKAGGVRVEAHWWPSHNWLINQRAALTAAAAAERNAQLRHAYRALDFFLMETRGAAKITAAKVREAVRDIGPEATQQEVARRLQVSEQGLTKWRARLGLNSWQEVLSRYAKLN